MVMTIDIHVHRVAKQLKTVTVKYTGDEVEQWERCGDVNS